ncbi:hypothetical protein JXB41_04000 [Candidatus Woesearchaeota archaeon]|nr:hypothetical protein [Candidatus Woesearchaeota archaeon]
MKKRAMESVEVWMWLIAGLIIGSLIFVSGYTLLSNWIRNNEVNDAMNSYSLLKSSIINVCSLGIERQEIESYIFPRIVNNITIENETDYGEGHVFCIDISGEPLYCEEIDEEPNSCKHIIIMDTVSFDNEKSLFSVVQKALGENKAVKLKFNINKRFNDDQNRTEIDISWKEEFIK